MHIVIDLETTGLPCQKPSPFRGYYPYTQVSRYESSRIVSICWIVLDDDFKETVRTYHVIKPDGFSIPIESTRIHGISHDEAVNIGVSIEQVIRELHQAAKNCRYFVAHNVHFDRNVLLSELHRYNANATLNKIKYLKTYCTMKNGRPYTALRKMPKLTELYKSIHNEEMTNAHNALDDAVHCCKCYTYMMMHPTLVTSAA